MKWSFLSVSLSLSQRVLEADAAEDAFNDDDDYEVDTPKRRHRGKGRVSDHMDTGCNVLKFTVSCKVVRVTLEV